MSRVTLQWLTQRFQRRAQMVGHFELATCILVSGRMSRVTTHRFAIAAVMFMVGVLTDAPALACSADSILTLLERKVEGHVTIRVDYTKESHSLLFGERPDESGVLWLGPPRRYRVEGKDQVVVRGSDTLWSYSGATKQVTVRTGGLDSLEFGPAGFFGSLRTDFVPVTCVEEDMHGHRSWRVRLVAKTETAAIQRLTLWIDQKSHWPRATEYVDYNEETSRLRFGSYRTDQAKDRQQFTFSPPHGAEVIVLPAKKKEREADSGR